MIKRRIINTYIYIVISSYTSAGVPFKIQRNDMVRSSETFERNINSLDSQNNAIWPK